MMTRVLKLADEEEARALLGDRDGVLRALNGLSPDVSVSARGLELTVAGSGPQAELLAGLVESMVGAVRQGHSISRQDAEYLGRRALAGDSVDVAGLIGATVLVSEKGTRIRPRTLGQLRYVEAIRKYGMTFCIGPAGTGKTYLAMALAVAALNAHEYERLILSRPAVEAGESLGFLPGDLREKVDPYLRPLYDALYDMLRLEKAQRLMERGTVEVVPLAYMRGRTLNDAFIVLDEAQNTTESQMKMFLTRMGYSSKVVVTGDVTQVDLPAGKGSGMIQAVSILRNIGGLGFVELTDEDVVRHPLVRSIIRAYEAVAESARNSGGDEGTRVAELE